MTGAPVVGLLVGRAPEERYSMHRGYVFSINACGGIPVLFPAGSDADPYALCTMVDLCCSLVLTGGGDIDPNHYGAAELADPDLLMEVDPSRDIAEIVVVQYALAQGKRVLGVCRGAQMLAVMGGGTLIADLKEKGLDGHWDEERQYEPVHPIEREGNSLAARILGSIERVNSIHHQAIADPGQAMRATAWSPDGVVEAVEGQGLLGVQWHPERLAASDPRQLVPFDWVVRG